MMFAPNPWHPVYAATTMPWGLTPLDDQQLGGMTMSALAGLGYLVATPVLLAAWLRAAERRAWRGDLVGSAR
jgi:putative membrane protein